jgi:5-methylcytosine-specific restriction endonuclease McrA
LYELFKTTKTCPICGITFTDNYKHGNINTTQTLDRINNENEINISNVWVICYKCNTIKGDFTMKEFVDYSKLVYEKFNGV